MESDERETREITAADSVRLFKLMEIIGLVLGDADDPYWSGVALSATLLGESLVDGAMPQEFRDKFFEMVGSYITNVRDKLDEIGEGDDASGTAH